MSLTTPKPIWIFDIPRSRSNVFFKLFSQHPQIQQIYHPYVTAAIFGPDRLSGKLEMSEAVRKEIAEDFGHGSLIDLTYADVGAQLRKEIEEVLEEKIVMGNEHCHMVMKPDIMVRCLRGKTVQRISESNPTLLPEWLLDTVRPVILVRHPAFTVPSLAMVLHKQGSVMGPMEEAFGISVSLRWSRILYDFFSARGQQPIVVDGDDTVWRLEEMTTALCSRLGLDRDGVKESWPMVTQESMAEMFPNVILQGYFRDLIGTAGVKRPTEGEARREVSLDVEETKWREIWGEKTAGELRAVAESNLEDWEYLMKFKI